MVRGISIALGIGLIILWITGLSQHATAWLTWLDGIAGLCAFGIAGVIRPGVAGSLAASPIALSVGLFVLWIIALAIGASGWLSWWTFVFACAFLLLGIAGGASLRRPMTTTPHRV